MKVKEAMTTLITDGGIFKYIAIGEFTDLTPSQLGIKYRFRSGEKSVNSLVEEYANGSGLSEESIRTLGMLVNDYYISDWTRIATALLAEYSPIENYDRNEDISVIGSGSDTDTIGSQTNQYGQRKVTDEHSVTPYNSNVMSPDDKNVQTEDARNDTFGSHTDTHTKGTTYRTTGRVHGNVGVTTNQQMITAELELRRNNFVDRVMSDVDKFFTLKVYE